MGAPSYPYRDGGEAALHRQREELFHARLAEADEVPRAVVAIGVRRVGRVAGGVGACVGALLVVLASAAKYGTSLFGLPVFDVVPATAILAATPVVSVLVAFVARLLARRAFVARALEDGLSFTRDARADVARFEATSATEIVVDRVTQLEQASVGWPLAGAALVLPLFLHFLIALAVTSDVKTLAHDFDDWIALSIVLTCVAHGVLVYLCFRFARDLRAWRAGGGADVAGGMRAWLLTTAAGLLPGGILAAIPTLIVAATGGVVIPTTFAWVKSRVAKERYALIV